MFSWFLNPWMLFGGLAVASPILIHLLNKRRFKIVEWAAMDFLFEAEKKNQRRVKVENFILLLLRCLAMLLIALMLARPFLPSSIADALSNKREVERILVIDDSLSQRVLADSLPALDQVKEQVKELLEGFAGASDTEDWLSIYLTSNPTERLVDYKPLTANSLPEILQLIEQIKCCDQVADYSDSLAEVSRYLEGQRENMGRAVYLYTDLRERDWEPAANQDSETAPKKLIADIGEKASQTFIIDSASDSDQNLAITAVRPQGGLMVVEKPVTFQVDVANFGNQTVSDVKVLLQVNDSQPEYQTVASLAPGKTKQLFFSTWFGKKQVDELSLTDDTQKLTSQGFRVRAEIDRQSLGNELDQDQLIEDSSRFYAARVADGIPILLVDGDPSAIAQRSETYFLRSLGFPAMGFLMDTVTASELETVSLANYSVIFLCNVDEASPDRIKAIQQWVTDGGSLVIMPGDRVRANTFNATFYNNGQGLAPARLDRIAGDPTLSRWVNFLPDPQSHAALEPVLANEKLSTFFTKVAVFSWWESTLNEDLVGKSVEVPLRFNNPSASPAMMDRSFGEGRVVMFSVPADDNWVEWIGPVHFTLMKYLIDYLAGSAGDESVLVLGGSIRQPVDLSAFRNRAKLQNPGNESIEGFAKPIDLENQDSELQEFIFENADQAGFYEVRLERHEEGGTEPVLFASNYDSAESQLKRLTSDQREEHFAGEKIKLVSGENLVEENVAGKSTEIWSMVLLLLFGILLTEQFLGWLWGQKR